MAKWLAEKCQYTNGTTYDLARVAEYFLYTQSGDRKPLERALQEKLNIGCTPRPIHTVLAQLLQIKIVLTSNYDTLLENELTRYGRNLVRDVYNLNNPRAGHFQGTIDFGEKDIILHKMHGSIDEPNSLVITQSDYIRYFANLHNLDRGMPEYFRKIMIPRMTLLFLGYSLDDWNFRVIWEDMLTSQQLHGRQRTSYAVVKQPPDFQKMFWFTRNVKILDGDLTDFAARLAERFDLEIPQLGINKKEAAGAAATSKPGIKKDGPIKILFLSTHPEDQSRLRLEAEIRNVKDVMLKSKYRERFQIIQEEAVRVSTLTSVLLRHKPDIVHFSGHSSFTNEIILEDESGGSQYVPAEALGKLFAQFKDTIRLVVLNASYSQLQAKYIIAHIDSVIGMSGAIGDEAAMKFSGVFYEALASGESLQKAFDLGCVNIQLFGLKDDDVPQLVAPNCNPEEIVFV
ncbi:MAG: SIR2 family protein [candidate division KSB1 bacterium]|nr:SIR2 family protein [candidate division KSB1 bacterium]MDZ7368986.1 SIR2 family protein [candidate division KSB1 bacterium]MDZ7406976.1 SIR2 family protein [candidate division KSB1 bacterium]